MMKRGFKMFDLHGKTALVTGSTQGIGLAIAKLFHEAGAEVIINGATSDEKCIKAMQEVGCSRYVTKSLSAPDAADCIYEKTGDVDILVLNASVQFRKTWLEITPEEFETQMNVNVRSSLAMIQKYYPHMKEQAWGRILTVGSVQQYRPHRDMAVYAASKCSLMSLVKNIAKQVAPYGVTVNNLCPGAIATPRNADAVADKEYLAKVLAGIPAGRMGLAEDCAPAALYLCSNEASYVTGSEIIVDGGMYL